MPLIEHGRTQIDHTDEGEGPAVLLLHSSVSGNRQWRALAETLRDRYRVLAPNLHGYGRTTPWPAGRTQTLDAQAELVLALAERVSGPLMLVGHSFGGAVAMKAAQRLGPRVQRLVLLEPNLAWLLRQAGRREAWLEVMALRDHVQHHGARGDWPAAAARFADYWLGDGAWAAMPERRREAFIAALPPNLHEWDAVMADEAPLDQWHGLPAQTLVVSDPATRRPIREIVELLALQCPHWTFHRIEGVGHMAPLTQPQRINPLVASFLDRGDGQAHSKARCPSSAPIEASDKASASTAM